MNKINSLQSIYDEFGEDICLYPFFGAFYQTNNKVGSENSLQYNSVRPCSVILESNQDVWNISSNQIIDSRNNDYWQEVRKNFIERSCHAVSGCSACSYNEKNGATSARKMNNHFFTEFLSCNIIEEVKSIIKNDFKSDKILALDYFPSNYCNYECIMCDGGASSTRFTFEVKVQGIKQVMKINDVDSDFYKILDTVEIINFTGGETILQNQVKSIIDYLIHTGRAKNIIITLISNCSGLPDKLEDKLRQFKDVFFTISIDGTGDVIEYQRRRSNWETVAKNSIQIYRTFGSVVNYVLTAINVFRFGDFVRWAHLNNMDRITISPVFRHEYYSLAVIPDEIKIELLQKLRADKTEYQNDHKWASLFDQVISVLEKSIHNSNLIPEFIKHIRQEDTVSKKKLVEVIPEWQPYFLN